MHAEHALSISRIVISARPMPANRTTMCVAARVFEPPRFCFFMQPRGATSRRTSCSPGSTSTMRARACIGRASSSFVPLMAAVSLPRSARSNGARRRWLAGTPLHAVRSRISSQASTPPQAISCVRTVCTVACAMGLFWVLAIAPKPISARLCSAWRAARSSASAAPRALSTLWRAIGRRIGC